MTRRLPLALAGLLLVSSPAAAEAPEPELNPCKADSSLKCPDLTMAPPSQLWVSRSARGRLLLHATNRIVNIGHGPLDLKGRRISRNYMTARQVLHRRNGHEPSVLDDSGRIYWKYVDSARGSYWKYSHAARFELWETDEAGGRTRIVRTGPKLDYCFRDLSRVRHWGRSPRYRVFPGCSQVHGLKTGRLGVSPGWADIYPSTYPENWIDITGFRGCFEFVHRADPLGGIAEEHEDNNLASRKIRLPPRNGSVAPRGCP